jgi:hypothetical protein
VAPVQHGHAHPTGARGRRAADSQHRLKQAGVDHPSIAAPRAQPPEGYVVSFARLHERGFNGPASKFMQGLCYYYRVELHNFTSNAISQAATFVSLCEGFLGIPVSWNSWLHLFRVELYTQRTESNGKRRPVRAGGLTFALREKGDGVYPPLQHDDEQSGLGQGVVLPPQRRRTAPALHGQGAERPTIQLGAPGVG